MREFFRIVVVALAAAASIACNREVYMPQVEEIVSDSARYVMPESHYGISADTASAARIKRYDFYTDRHLRRIIDTALAANPSIRIAVLQIEEAEAYFRRSRRERLPEVRADLHKLMQSVAAANAVRTRIIADAAALYYRLIILDARRISVEQSISRNDSIVTGCNILIDAAAWEKSGGEKRAKLLPHAQMVREQAASELSASKAPRQHRCRHSRPIASQPSRYNSCRGATVLRLRSHARRAGGPLSAFDAQGRRRSRDPQHGALVRPAVGLVVQCFRRFDATVVPTRRAAHATPRARGASKRFVHAFARCRACGAVRGIQHYDALRVCPSACHYLLFSGRIASSGDGSRPTAHVVGRVVSRRVGGADAIATSRKESLQRHAHDVRPTHSPISRTRRRLEIGVEEE